MYSDGYLNAKIIRELDKGEEAFLLKTYYKSGNKWDKIKTEDGRKGYLLNADIFKIKNASVNKSRVFVHLKPSEQSQDYIIILFCDKTNTYYKIVYTRFFKALISFSYCSG